MKPEFADAVAEFMFQEHQCGGSPQWSGALDRLYDCAERQAKTSTVMKAALDRWFPDGVPPPEDH
jgi:hypothetical protein